MRKLTTKQIDEVKAQLAPGERIVEITTTVRWVTEKDLESATAELKALTDQFNPDKRIDGYVDAKLLTY